MDLTIIIVNWKSVDFLARCLASIYAVLPGMSLEVVVIDNASFDGCDTMLSERFPAVHFLQNATNTGFAGANNFAFSRSTGATVCFLNPDTILRGTALPTLYAALHSIPDAGAVGAVLFNGDGSLQTSCVLPFPTILNQALDIEWLRQRFPRAGLFGAAALFSSNKEPHPVEAVSGACIMIRRKTFLEIGMFSTDYFMYAEDIDLCRKVRMTGHKIYLINSAEIVHFGGGSSNKHKNRLFSALLIRDSNYRMLRKFRGRGYALFYRMVLGISALVRVTVLLVWLIPATVTGHGRSSIKTILRWLHLAGWVVGIIKAPLSFNPVLSDV